MSLFELPVARIKRISDEIKQLEARLEHGRFTPGELKTMHSQRAALVKTMDDLELRTRKSTVYAAMR